MKTVGSSPVLPEVQRQVMDFPSAMKQIMKGKKIFKLEWKDPKYYGNCQDGFLTLHTPAGTHGPWVISDGDLMGKDYIVTG